VLFSDVGYTALMAEDEAAGLRAREHHRSLLAPLAEQYHGEIVDENGDELVACFGSVLDAVNCALAAQARLKSSPQLRLRIGIHEGDVTFQAGRIYGDGVNLAARIRPLAEPGGICISDDAQHSVRNQPGIELTPLGAKELKNVGRLVEVFAVRGTPAKPSADSAKQAGGPSRGAAWVFFGTALAIAAAIVWLWSSPFPGPAAANSIAVLPFADMSIQGDQEYLADGMAEELIARLSKVEDLRVVARTSAFAFKGKNVDIREIGNQLGVGAVVEGSVRKAEDRLRITAQLVQVADGFPLWSQTYDRQLDDVFAVQQEIAQAVASALQVRLSASGIAERPTEDIRAYELYLIGRHFWSLRTEAGIRQAIEYYSRALAIDPGYAMALSGVADAYGMLWVYRFDTNPEVVFAARKAAAEALRLNPSLGEAHASLAMLNSQLPDGDGDSAEEHFRRALELSPGHATAYAWYALENMRRGHKEQGLAAIRRALDLDPLSPVVNRYAGYYEMLAGNQEQAIERLRRAVDLSPESAMIRLNLVHVYLLADLEEEAFATVLGLDLPPGVRQQLRDIHRSRGMPGVIAAFLQLEQKRTGRACPPQPDAAAMMYAHLKDADGVFRCLEESASVGAGGSMMLDPVFAPFRPDPRFSAILRRLRLAE
jgi:TolB-like protein